ncbi:TPA: hypothetical protein ACH3X2_007482 [Trebouxia sp. C0005]
MQAVNVVSMRLHASHLHSATPVWPQSDLLSCSYRQQRRPLHKFGVLGRAATPGTQQQQRRKPQDPTFRADQLSQLAREVFDLALQSGPKGFARSIQAANAFASVGRDYAQSIRQGKTLPPETVLRKLFEQLGATYIKLGQFVASSPTLFPEAYVLEFQKCLDKTDPVPWKIIRQTIQEELTQPIDAVFSDINPTPLATASVAQVHCALLRESQKEVVLKVLKPGVEDILATDLNFLLVTTKLFEVLNPQLARASLAGIVSDIRTSMLEEIDFRKEVQHIQQFSAYLDRTGMRQGATCPYVYKQLSSPRLLTMERLHGVPLTDLAAIRSITSADPEQTLITALNTWFGSVLGCETFHADVHAGNLLVLKDGRLGFIDFGIVGKISPITFQAMEAFLMSSMTADYNTMARALITMGVTREQVVIEDFAEDLRTLFAQADALDMGPLMQPGGNPQAAAADMATDAGVNKLLLQVVQVGDTHGIRFPREFGLLLKQLLYFDRYTQLLAPSLSVLNDDRVKIRQNPGPVIVDPDEGNTITI